MTVEARLGPEAVRIDLSLKQLIGRLAEMIKSELRCLTASPGTVKIAGLNEVGLVHIFQCDFVLLNRRCQRFDPDRSPVELFDDRQQDFPVHIVKPGTVDSQPGQCLLSHLPRDMPLGFDLRIVPNPPDQAVHDPRSATGPPRNLRSALESIEVPRTPAERVTIRSKSPGE